MLTAPVSLDATWTPAQGVLESSPPFRAMLSPLRKRSRPEPLKPRPQPTWRVVRDRLSQVVESTPLEPLVDLRAVLTAAREARIAEGWECEDIGPLCGPVRGIPPTVLSEARRWWVSFGRPMLNVWASPEAQP